MSIAGKAIVPFQGDFSALTAGAAKSVESIAERFKGLLGPVAIVGTSLAAVGGFVVDLGAKYQKTSNIMAAAAGDTIAQAAKIGRAFLATGGQTVYTAQQMMTALAPVGGVFEFIAGKPLTVAQNLAVMRAAMNLAAASNESLDSATTTLAHTMLAFGVPLAGVNTATDILYNTSKALGVPLDSLGNSLQRARTAAGAAAPSLGQLSAFLLDLAQHGESGRGAVSLLNSALTGIETPTKAVLKAQKDLNLSFIDAKGRLDPLSQIIGEISPKIDKMGNAQATAYLKSIGFGSASSKLVDLMQAGVPAFDKASAAVTKTGTAQADAQTATSGLSSLFDKLKGKVIDAATSFGITFIPKLTAGFDWMMKTGIPDLEKFGKWVGQNIITPFMHVAQVVVPILLGALGFVVGHLNDIKVPALILGGILAGMWTVNKIAGWASAAKSAISGVLAAATASTATGAASSGFGLNSELVGQRVFVTNWEMMRGGPGGGLPLPPALGGPAAPVAAETMGSGLLAAGGATTLAIGGGLVAAAVASGLLVLKGINDKLKSTLGDAAKATGLTAQQFTDFQQSYAQASPQLKGLISQTVASMKAQGDSQKKITQATYATWNVLTDLQGAVGKTVPQIDGGFVVLENHLTAMGLSFAKSVSASDGLQAYITKYGPLTSEQMLIFYNDISHGVTSADDIKQSLQTINIKLAPAIGYADAFAKALKNGSSITAATITARGLSGGGGSTNAGGGVISEEVVGVGTRSGKPYSFAEGNVPEFVLNQPQMAAMLRGNSGGRGAQGGSFTQVNTFHLHGTEDSMLARIGRLIEQNNAELARAYELAIT
jgi:TP901 family phage tail tape measure protein